MNINKSQIGMLVNQVTRVSSTYVSLKAKSDSDFSSFFWVRESLKPNAIMHHT